MLREFTLDTVQAEPVDVGLRRGGGRDVSALCTNDKCVGVASEAGRREVPLRRQPSSGDGVRDEVVLAEDECGLDHCEIVHDGRGGDRLGCMFPSGPYKVGDGPVSQFRKARDIKDFCVCTDVSGDSSQFMTGE